MTTKYIDYLTEDEPITKPYAQNWVCLSFLSPEGVRNCNIRGLKVRGVYATKSEADARANELAQIDPDFHIFVGEIGKWLEFDPSAESVEDQIYQEKELNDLMKGYKDNLEKVKRMQSERKTDMIRQAAYDEQNKPKTQEEQKKSATQTRLKKKLEEKKMKEKLTKFVDNQSKQNQTTQNQTTQNQNQPKLTLMDEEAKKTIAEEKEILETEEELKTIDKMAETEKERLAKTQQVINKKTSNLESVDAKLAKIQELYNKLNKK
jgi:hypothetical protein